MSNVIRGDHEDWLRDFQVVWAAPHHVDLVAPLFDQYRIFYGQRPDLDAARGFVCERLIRRDSVLFLAFCGEDRPVPLGLAQLYPTFSSIAMKIVGIERLVCRAARSRGVARKLMENAWGSRRRPKREA